MPGSSRNAPPAKGAVGPNTKSWTASAAQSAADQADAASAKPSSGEAAAALKTETAVPSAAAQDPQSAEQAAFGGGGYQGGEFILSDLGDGTTAIAVVSPAGDFSMREIQPADPPCRPPSTTKSSAKAMPCRPRMAAPTISGGPARETSRPGSSSASVSLEDPECPCSAGCRTI